MPASVQELSSEEIRRLVHELQVHQMELEMQNEELRRAQHELQMARDAYADLYDLAPIGYLTLGKDNLIREANLTAACMLGLERRALIGQPISRFVAWKDQDALYQHRAQLERTPERQACEITIVRRDGSRFDAQLASVGVPDPEGIVRTYRCVISDISERKQIERTRKAFFSVASHELRTPLNNLGLSLDLIAQSLVRETPPAVRSMLAIARRNNDRLTRLVDDFLAIQRGETGEMPLRNEPLELTPLVHEVLESNRAYSQQWAVRYSLVSSVPGVKVCADGDRLIQVLTNLLSNAVKFSTTPATVEVAVTRRDGAVRVTVTDHGPGISKDFREQVFQPFAQASPSLEDAAHKGSAGLGLSIAKSIIERLGGRIGFTSQPYIATTFYFELPEWHAGPELPEGERLTAP